MPSQHPSRLGRTWPGRVVAAGALLIAVALVALILLSGGTGYRVRVLFANAGGLVDGDPVLVGPGHVGSVQSVALTRSGLAAVTIGVDSASAPLHAGTIADIEENGLAGIASHYVTLQPAPASGPAIRDGGTIPLPDTRSEVSLDALFDAFDPLTRAGLRGIIRGEAAAIDGRSAAAGATIDYLDPALEQTSAVTAELSRSEPAFDALLVDGARTMQALASRSEQLSDLIGAAASTSRTVADQSGNLDTTLGLLPQTLTRSTASLNGLRTTLATLTPVVQVATPAVRTLPQLAAALRRFAASARPTVAQLAQLLDAAGLTGLLQRTPALARLAQQSFPRVITSENVSQHQLDALREYTPDLVAALSDLGQAGANYDANGHYVRTQPWFGAFTIDAENALEPQPAADRYDGLEVVHGRCPGAAVAATTDGSAPFSVPGCTLSANLPGS